MTALIVAFIVWAIVAFMVSDGQVRRDEKRALMFFVLLGLVLTAVGVWQFERAQLFTISLHDWLLVFFFPVFLLGFAVRVRLVKVQSAITRKAVAWDELDLSVIPASVLVGLYRALRFVTWTYAVVIVVLQLGRALGVTTGQHP